MEKISTLKLAKQFKELAVAITIPESMSCNLVTACEQIAAWAKTAGSRKQCADFSSHYAKLSKELESLHSLVGSVESKYFDTADEKNQCLLLEEIPAYPYDFDLPEEKDALLTLKEMGFYESDGNMETYLQDKTEKDVMKTLRLISWVINVRLKLLTELGWSGIWLPVRDALYNMNNIQ